METERVPFTEDEVKQGFRVGVFQTSDEECHNNYECGRCAYATLYKDKMLDHQRRGNHVWGQPGGPHIIDKPKEVVRTAPKEAVYGKDES